MASLSQPRSYQLLIATGNEKLIFSNGISLGKLTTFQFFSIPRSSWLTQNEINGVIADFLVTFCLV